jgi:hypothetical protein
LRTASPFSALAARRTGPAVVRQKTSSAAVADDGFANASMQRSFFTGNFSAGATALIHPDLLLPEKKTRKEK